MAHGNDVSFNPRKLVDPSQWQAASATSEGSEMKAQIPVLSQKVGPDSFASSLQWLLYTEHTKYPKASTFLEVGHICDSAPASFGTPFPTW